MTPVEDMSVSHFFFSVTSFRLIDILLN